MSDLIKRQDVIDAIYKESKYANSEVADEYADMFVYAINTLPSAQKTGKWIEAEQRDRTICSVCGYWQDLKAKFLFSFCPNCGSLMRGGYTNENISESSRKKWHGQREVRKMDELFGKYCYIDTPWIAGKKTRYRILGSGVLSNAWCEVPVTGHTELVMHDHREDVVFVVLDTLVSDDSIIRRFAMKDVEIIKQEDE